MYTLGFYPLGVTLGRRVRGWAGKGGGDTRKLTPVDHYVPLYPDVDLSDVNKIFQHDLALIKNAIIVDTGVEEWSPPNHLLDAGTLWQRLVMTAKETAYKQYFRWHTSIGRR